MDFAQSTIEGTRVLPAYQQAQTDYVTSKAQEQVNPKIVEQSTIQAVQATQLQKANIDKLQAIVQSDKAVQKAFGEASASGATGAKLLDEIVKRLPGTDASLAAIEGIEKLSSTMQLHEAQSQVQKERAAAMHKQRGLDLGQKYDWSKPDQVEQMIAEGLSNKLMDKGEPDMIRAAIRNAGPKAAKEFFDSSHKTEEQRDRDIKEYNRKKEAEEREKDRKSAEAERKSHNMAIEALSRDNLDFKKQQASKDNRAEKQTAAKARISMQHINDQLETDRQKAQKEYKREFAYAEKEGGGKISEEKAAQLLRDRDDAIDNANERARSDWAIKEHEGQAPQIPKSEVAPAYETWATAAKATNPNATDAELKAYYNKKYGKK